MAISGDNLLLFQGTIASPFVPYLHPQLVFLFNIPMDLPLDLARLAFICSYPNSVCPPSCATPVSLHLHFAPDLCTFPSFQLTLLLHLTFIYTYSMHITLPCT